jgi:hypothetical protein
VATGALARRHHCACARQLGAVMESSGGSAGVPQSQDGRDVGEGEKDDARLSRLPADGEEGEATWCRGKSVELRRNLDERSA